MVGFIARGAEAELFETHVLGMRCVVKRRVEKKYRVPQLDEKLRKTRTKREAYLLHKAKEAGVKVPLLLGLSEFEITMSFEEGVLLKDLLEDPVAASALGELGAVLALLHKNWIVHGDFTPANALVNEGKVTLIDFGLGAFSKELEDAAVDGLLMKKALGNEKLFELFSTAYSEENPGFESVFKQLEKIEERARYVVRKQAQ